MHSVLNKDLEVETVALFEPEPLLEVGKVAMVEIID
jgi:hypothetical protein